MKTICSGHSRSSHDRQMLTRFSSDGTYRWNIVVHVLSLVLLLCCAGCCSSQSSSPSPRTAKAEKLPTGQIYTTTCSSHKGFALSICKSPKIWALRGSAVGELAIQLRNGDDAYDLLKQELWHGDRKAHGFKCVGALLRSMALIEPSKGAQDVQRYVSSYHQKLSFNNEAVAIREAIKALGDALRFEQDSKRRGLIRRMLEEYLHGGWVNKTVRWADSTSEAMHKLVRQAAAKGAFAAFLRSGRRADLNFIGSLGTEDPETAYIPDYVIEGYSRKARELLRSLPEEQHLDEELR